MPNLLLTTKPTTTTISSSSLPATSNHTFTACQHVSHSP